MPHSADLRRLYKSSAAKAGPRHALRDPHANYITSRLIRLYPVLYTRPNVVSSHDLIFRPFARSSVARRGALREPIVAKLLIGLRLSPRRSSFPFPEHSNGRPTESEPSRSLDRFCDAFIAIRRKCPRSFDCTAHPQDNVLKERSHTLTLWRPTTGTHPSSREQAAFPLP